MDVLWYTPPSELNVECFIVEEHTDSFSFRVTSYFIPVLIRPGMLIYDATTYIARTGHRFDEMIFSLRGVHRARFKRPIHPAFEVDEAGPFPGFLLASNVVISEDNVRSLDYDGNSSLAVVVRGTLWGRARNKGN
jgi:hypothetical protein